MGTKGRTIKYTVDVETHLTDISDEIKKYESDIQGLQNKIKNGAGSKELEKRLQTLLNTVSSLKQSYISAIKDLSSAKLDSAEFEKFQKTVDNRLQEVNQRMIEVEQSIVTLSKDLKSFDAGKEFAKQMEPMERKMKNLMKDMRSTMGLVKDFQEMINMKFNDKELVKITKAALKLNNLDLSMGTAEETTSSVEELEQELENLIDIYDEMNDKLGKSGNGRVARQLQKQMADNITARAKVIKQIAKIQGDTYNPYNVDYETNFGSLKTVAENLQNDTDILLNQITESKKELEQRKKDLDDSVSTNVASFQFKDGGIKIPVILDPKGIEKLQPALNGLVQTLNNYAEKNPVDVVFRLFPMGGTRSEEKELAKAIKDIRVQIPKTNDPELQKSLNGFVDNLEKQYQQALQLNIAINLSESATSIQQKIDKIQKAVKEKDLNILPKFVVSEEEENKLKAVLQKVQSDFSFDIAKDVGEMATQLNKLLDDNRIKTWGDAFTSELTKIESKLQGMKDLIQPLADLTVSQKIKNKRGRPSKETVENRSYVEQFTSALDSLNRALSEKKKLDSQAKQFVDDIQNKISDKPVTVQLKPNTSGFIDAIQEDISNQPVKVKVVGVAGDGNIQQVVQEQASLNDNVSNANNVTPQQTVNNINQTVEAKKKAVRISKEELALQKEFNGLLNTYLDALAQMRRGGSDKAVNDAQTKAYALIKRFPSFEKVQEGISEAQRERLFDKYYQEKTGKTRNKAHYSNEAIYDIIKESIKKQGTFSISGKDNKDNRELLERLIRNYIEYQKAGGKRQLTGLTSNKRIQKNLEKEYNRQTESIKQNTEAKQENQVVEQNQPKSNNTIQSTTDDIQKQTEAIEENTKAQEKNNEVSHVKASKGVSDIESQKQVKETKDYASMTQEELQQCLATEEKWFAKCKEGSEAYERRKKNIEEIQSLLSSTKTNSVTGDIDDITNQNIVSFERFKNESSETRQQVENDIKSQKQKYEELGRSARRVFAEIGMTYDEYVKQANSQKRDINWQERLAFVSDDIIKDSIHGNLTNVGWPDNIIDDTITKILHFHPHGKGEEEVFSSEDLLVYFEKVLSKGFYHAPLELWQRGQKTTLDFGDMPRQVIPRAMTALSQVYQVVERNLKENGGTIASRYTDEYQQLTNSLFKAIMEKYGGKFETEKDYNSKINKELVKNNLDVLEEFVSYMRGDKDGNFHNEDDASTFMFLQNLFEKLKNGEEIIDNKITPELQQFKEKYEKYLSEIRELMQSDNIDDITEAGHQIGFLASMTWKSASLDEQGFVGRLNEIGDLQNKWIDAQAAIYNGKKNPWAGYFKEQAKEAGEAAVEGAKEGTEEAQKSKSPSKVAEALGEYWGEGYANGIRKHKDDVENAVRELVQTGIITTEDLQKDLDTLLSGGFGNRYNALKNPLQNILGADNEQVNKSRSSSWLRGQITQRANKIANDPNIDKQGYAKLAMEAANFVNELERAGEKTDEIKQKFKDLTKSTFDRLYPQQEVKTEDSVSEINKETEAVEEMPEAFEKTSQSKTEFADANGKVLSSIVESVKGLKDEKQAIEVLGKLINSLGGKDGDNKLQKTVNGLQEIYKVLNADIGENALVKSLNELASHGVDLEKLATVLKATKKQVNDAKKATATPDTRGGDIIKNVEVGANAKHYLQQFGIPLNAAVEDAGKGIVKITSTVLTARDEFRRYTLETTDGINMTIKKEEEKTAGLEKEILLYQKLNRAYGRFVSLDDPNPLATGETFIKEGSVIWDQVIEYAKEYGDDLGNILSVTRNVREANGEMLESFKIIGENGSVTIGAENDVVGSVQNIANITKQYKELENVINRLQKLSADNEQTNKYTDDYINQVNDMIQRARQVYESPDFLEPDRMSKLVDEANQLLVVAKNTDNMYANMKGVEKIRGKIEDILHDYGAMPRALRGEFESLLDTVKEYIKLGEVSKTQADQISADFVRLNSDLSQSGKKYQSMWRQMFERLRSESSQLLARYFSFQDWIRYGRTAITTIIDLDTQLVDLRKTTSMNNTELEMFYKNASNISKQLGVTTSEIISQAAAWSRLGYSSNEAATTMAQLSSKFASVSPGMGTDDAQDYLVSTMQAYGVAVDDVERKIMDNVNRIGNTFATTNAEIGEMLKRSSAAMNAANNSLEQTIALESAAVQVTRNAETTGTAFRTVSMRIRGLDEETEDTLENYEELKGKIADLTKTDVTPGGISLFTDATKTEFKSTYQFLKEIAGIWDKLTDKAQAGLLETIAGKRGAQVLAGLLADFSEVDRAMEEMEGAAGSADKEMSIIRDSIEFKINALKQTWVSVLQDVADRGQIGGVIDFLTSVSEGLGSIVSNLGLVKTAIIGISAVIGSQKLGLFDTGNNKTLIGGIAEMRNNRRTAAMKREGLSQILDIYGDKPDQFLNAGFSKLADDFEPVKSILVDIQKQAKETGATGEEALGMVEDAIGDVEIEGSRLGGIFKNIGKSLVNGLASAAISAAITFAIDGLSKLIDTVIMTEEEARRLSTQFQDDYKSMVADQSKTVKELDDINDEYQKLSKGVNSLGENVTLTETEFKRYHEITKTIADYIPTAIAGYDNQGEAIIRLRDDVDSLTDAYKENQKEAAKALYNKVDENDGAYIRGVSENFQNRIRTIKYDTAEIDYNRSGNGGTGTTYYIQREADIFEQINAYQKLSRMSYDEAMRTYQNAGTIEKTLLKNMGMTAQTTAEQFNDIHSNIISTSEDLVAGLETDTQSIKDIIGARVRGFTGYFQELNDTSRKYVDAVINNLGADQIVNEQLYLEENWKQFSSQLVDSMNSIQNNKAFTDKIEARINLVTQLNSGDISIGEYLNNVQILQDWLNSLPDGDLKKYITIIFGINTTEDTKVLNAKNRLKMLMGDNYSDSLLNDISASDLDKILEIPIKPVYDERGFQKTIQREGYDERGFKLNIIPEVSQYSIDEIKKILEDDISPIEVEIEPKASSAVDSMAEAKSAIASLNSLYDQVVNKTEADGQATGFADPALINSVESSFSNFIKTAQESGKDVTEMNAALENFERTLVEFPNEETKAQDAIDELITAYIDQTDIIQNLTEANKEWSIAQLKAFGITNAEEVVETRLAKTNKRLSKSYSVLKESIDNYNDALNRGDEEAKTKELETMAKELNTLYNYKDSNGAQLNLFDTQFVQDNLDLIQQSIDDTSGKFNELDRIASKQYIAKMAVEADDESVSALYGILGNLINDFDGQSIDIGTSMDGGPIFTTLEAIREATKMTVKEFQELVRQASGGTIEANVTYDLKKVSIPYTRTWVTGHADSNGNYQEQYQDVKMRIPKFTYQYVGKGKGAKATYTPPASKTDTTGGSSGGSNGSNSGSDNKLQEDTKETFDWIEVKIQRLEEAIARLDKQVGNTYIKWGKRNKSLTNELGKVTEEIKVQEHAQKRYLQNAQAISNTAKNKNNRVDAKPKKSDYEKGDKQYTYDLKQWKKANELWKSGKYQKLIQQGKIGKDDIERIQNKYLVNLINQYKELYQKSVDAGDKVDDLKIKLGDLNKTKFDNIKSEYEGLISLIEDANNLVEERINNTQERGYFVNKKYYQQEIKNVKEERKKKETEYKKLIKIRDEAVSSGAIEKNSEAWVQMTNDINAAELALLQYDTEIIKLNNDIRQLKWDAFDFGQQRLDRITSETETLIDLLDSLPLYDENGKFTNRGRATEALYGIQYDVAAKKAEEYRKAIKDIETTMDPYDQKAIERLDAMKDGLWEQTKAMEAAKDATKDLIANGIQKHIESLNKLIDKYKQSLSDAKSLYDYQKNIAQQTKNIASLEKQLASYAGDESEESRANIQKLTEQLEEARTGLKETEWDKYISETNDMLDKMTNEYQEYMNKWLEDINAVFKWAVGDVNSHVDEISKTLRSVAGNDGVSLSSQLKSMLQTSTENNTALITAYNKGNAELSSTVEKGLDKILANAKDITNGEQSGNKKTTTKTTSSNSKSSSQQTDNKKKNEYNNKKSQLDNEYKQQTANINAKITQLEKEEKQKIAALNKDIKNAKTKAEKTDFEKEVSRISEQYDKELVALNQRKEILTQAHDSDLASLRKKYGYASGSHGITNNQLAWTQENGSELIFRKADGAILTPLNRGDMVFTHDMSQALWDIAKNPNIFKQTVNVPNVGARTINNDNNLTVVLPNVMNYEQFKSAMMSDPKVKNFVQATTIGQALGKGKLNRGNL